MTASQPPNKPDRNFKFEPKQPKVEYKLEVDNECAKQKGECANKEAQKKRCEGEKNVTVKKVFAGAEKTFPEKRRLFSDEDLEIAENEKFSTDFIKSLPLPKYKSGVKANEEKGKFTTPLNSTRVVKNFTNSPPTLLNRAWQSVRSYWSMLDPASSDEEDQNSSQTSVVKEEEEEAVKAEKDETAAAAADTTMVDAGQIASDVDYAEVDYEDDDNATPTNQQRQQRQLQLHQIVDFKNFDTESADAGFVAARVGEVDGGCVGAGTDGAKIEEDSLEITTPQNLTVQKQQQKRHGLFKSAARRLGMSSQKKKMPKEEAFTDGEANKENSTPESKEVSTTSARARVLQGDNHLLRRGMNQAARFNQLLQHRHHRLLRGMSVLIRQLAQL